MKVPEQKQFEEINVFGTGKPKTRLRGILSANPF